MEELHAIRERCTQEWSWQQVDQIFLNMGVDGYTFPWSSSNCTGAKMNSCVP